MQIIKRRKSHVHRYLKLFPILLEVWVEVAISGDLELDLLKKRLQETEKAMERIVAKMMSLPNNIEQSEVSNILVKTQRKKLVAFCALIISYLHL